jgi:hypothetical protein
MGTRVRVTDNTVLICWDVEIHRIETYTTITTMDTTVPVASICAYWPPATVHSQDSTLVPSHANHTYRYKLLLLVKRRTWEAKGLDNVIQVERLVAIFPQVII